MATVESIVKVLAQHAPLPLAEEWDNVGLLVGDYQQPVRKIMTCLTITPDSAAEAVEQGVDLIVTHHPLPFRPLKRLTTATLEGRLLLELIAARVAVYSAHTAYDSAATGINQQLAQMLRLRGVAPLQVDNPPPALGSGRWGRTEQPTTLGEVAENVKALLGLNGLHVVGEAARPVTHVGIACGSGGDFLNAALAAGCDVLLTGEARFHTCLAAEAEGIGLILAGHYASERFALEQLAELLGKRFGDEVEVWASRNERDPLRWT